MNAYEKQREALTALVSKSENFISRVECYGISSYYLEDYEEDKEEFQKQISSSETVLALPPRNCDIFLDHEEAWVAYKRIAQNGGYFDAITLWEFIKWLYDEAKGESDESK